MGKKRDMAWAEKLAAAFPPANDSMSLTETILFMNLEEPIYGVIAAYNDGFKRGRAYGEKKRREP